MSEEIGRLCNRLLDARNVTTDRSLASEIQQRLGTASFRAALSKESDSEDGSSNGWSTLLKVCRGGVLWAAVATRPARYPYARVHPFSYYAGVCAGRRHQAHG